MKREVYGCCFDHMDCHLEFVLLFALLVNVCFSPVQLIMHTVVVVVYLQFVDLMMSHLTIEAGLLGLGI